MIAIIILFFFISICIFGLYQKNSLIICKSRKRLDGKTVLVTGGTSGIGLEVALDLAERGARVIIACPFEDEGIAAKNEIQTTTENENVIFKYLDLASFESVRKLSKEILNTEKRLDILINNAGAGINESLTEDGINYIMQVNYIGHFYLTLLLLPLLIKTGSKQEPARIINTSSNLHVLGMLDVESFTKPTSRYISGQAYCNSKLSLLLFSHELTKKISGKNVVINCVNPGSVATNIFTSVSSVFGLISKYVMPYIVSKPWEGAQTTLHVALDKKAGKVSGKYFKNCKEKNAMFWAYDDKNSKILWDESLRIVKIENVDFL